MLSGGLVFFWEVEAGVFEKEASTCFGFYAAPVVCLKGERDCASGGNVVQMGGTEDVLQFGQVRIVAYEYGFVGIGREGVNSPDDGADALEVECHGVLYACSRIA